MEKHCFQMSTPGEREAQNQKLSTVLVLLMGAERQKATASSGLPLCSEAWKVGSETERGPVPEGGKVTRPYCAAPCDREDTGNLINFSSSRIRSNSH